MEARQRVKKARDVAYRWLFPRKPNSYLTRVLLVSFLHSLLTRPSEFSGIANYQFTIIMLSNLRRNTVFFLYHRHENVESVPFFTERMLEVYSEVINTIYLF